MRILLIAGGWSSERDVSLKGAIGVEQALKELGHEVIRLDPLTELDQLFTRGQEADFAFINLHGSPGEDGLIQAMLENIRLPYQGADSRSSLIALNKHATKIVYRNNGLQTPDWIFKPFGYQVQNLPLPFVVKPNTGGSSLGIHMVRDMATWEQVQKDLHEDVLLEQYIQGRELTCPVLDNQALPPILIQPRQGDFFDYACKYANGGADEICPAPVEKTQRQQLQHMALTAHKALGLRDYSRTDFIADEHGRLFLLETNTLPGMTPASLLPKSALAAGLSFRELIARLIELGMQRYNH